MSQEAKLWLKRNLHSVVQRLITESPDYDGVLDTIDEALLNSLVNEPMTTSSSEELVTASGETILGRFPFDSEYNEYLINAYIALFLLNKGSIGDVPSIVERYK